MVTNPIRITSYEVFLTEFGAHTDEPYYRVDLGMKGYRQTSYLTKEAAAKLRDKLVEQLGGPSECSECPFTSPAE